MLIYKDLIKVRMEENVLDINPGCQGSIPQDTSTYLSFLA